MQSYFFHLNYVRDYVTDRDGSLFADLEAAKAEARQIIRELAADVLKSHRKFTLNSIRICSDDGSLVASIHVPEALTEVLRPTSLSLDGRSRV